MEPKYAQLLRIEHNEVISKESHPEFMYQLEHALLLALQECGQLNIMQYRYASEKLTHLHSEQAKKHKEKQLER